MTFKSWKKILKIYFLAVTRSILEKKYILANFRIIFQKNWHNYWRHHPYSCNFEIFLQQFFCNITSMTVPNFLSKAFPYQSLRRLGRGPGLDMLKLCKVRHDHKTLISVFQVPKVYFGKENWTLNYALIQFWDFCNISLFLKVLSLKPLDISRSNSYKFSYTTYQFRFYCGKWILH